MGQCSNCRECIRGLNGNGNITIKIKKKTKKNRKAKKIQLLAKRILKSWKSRRKCTGKRGRNKRDEQKYIKYSNDKVMRKKEYSHIFPSCGKYNMFLILLISPIGTAGIVLF